MFPKEENDGHGKPAAKEANDGGAVPGKFCSTPLKGHQNHRSGWREEHEAKEIEFAKCFKNRCLLVSIPDILVGYFDEQEKHSCNGTNGQVDKKA